MLDNSTGIIAGCIGNIRWAVTPLGLETDASSYFFGENFGGNFGGIFGEPLPHGHAARTPKGIIIGGGNEGDS